MSERSETESERDLDNVEVSDDDQSADNQWSVPMPGPVWAGGGLQQEILTEERGGGNGGQGRLLPSAISGHLK